MTTFRRVPDEQIAAAHAQRAAAHPPAPTKVRNAVPVVALNEARPVRWSGHYYHVPRLSFADGMRLLVVSQVLASSRHRPARKIALHSARAILHRVVRTRRFGRSCKPWRNPFRHLTDEQAPALLDEILNIPDESPRTGGRGGGGVSDLMDGYLGFCERFPALVGPDGNPVSWAHYQYGVRHLPRLAARDLLRAAQSTRVGHAANRPQYEKFESEQRSIAGWH